ncbi:Receptor expression-enhancing protein 3 [Bagarius yarrelli]|uniref:Receptor expression-enhancing protein n=1 Tax=Bagarius yarrelli TaxID=175774 RepID=A0A556TIJ7_BAGYA|nr:Receptor expression-enhancing protein 3 [Bagarius yarrelli]
MAARISDIYRSEGGSRLTFIEVKPVVGVSIELTASLALGAVSGPDLRSHALLWNLTEHGVVDHFENRRVRWMMYWIVFALYTVAETIADLTVAWFPLYYEIKIACVIWLVSPYTRGASLIYRKVLHPLLTSRERGQGAITEKLRSFSMADLTQISQDDGGGLQYSSYTSQNPARRALASTQHDGVDYYEDANDERMDDENEAIFSEDEAVTQRGLRRSQSTKVSRSKLRKDARYGSLKIKGRRRPALNTINYANPDQ